MIKAALIGCPNAGKTTLFNALTGEHAKTGNWHGVTVEAKTARIKNSDCVLCDLPGIYGLYAYSPEEKASEDYIKQNPDSLFLSVVPAADLARGIKTTAALIERGLKTALVLTFYDEFAKRGGKLDLNALKAALGVPVLAVNGNSGADIKRLKAFIGEAANLPAAAVKPVINELSKFFTPPAFKESFIDKILLNKYASPLCFLLVTAAVFFLTFGKNSPGALLQGLVASAADGFAGYVKGALGGVLPEPVTALLCDGVLEGAGGVLCFLPQLALLYLFITLLEESGFMARIAFMFDGLFRKIGLNGRAVFSVFMGFGCTAVAALSTKALDNKNLQKKAALALPFVSCSARLPIYLVLINAFFTKNKVLVLLALYMGGLLLAALTSALLDKFIYKTDKTFIMELPDMRLVGAKKLLKVLLYYLKQFIMRVGGVIMLVMISLWFTKSFSFTMEYVGLNVDRSILASLGKALKYLFYPMGVTDWRLGVSVISGLFAKEAIVGTLEILCPEGIAALMTPAQGLAFMVFCALYTPCLSALAAMKKEIGLKATAVSAAFTFVFALVSGYLTYFLSLVIQLSYVKPALAVLAAIMVIAALIKKFMFGKCARCGACRGHDEGNCKHKKRKAN